MLYCMNVKLRPYAFLVPAVGKAGLYLFSIRNAHCKHSCYNDDKLDNPLCYCSCDSGQSCIESDCC